MLARSGGMRVLLRSVLMTTFCATMEQPILASTGEPIPQESRGIIRLATGMVGGTYHGFGKHLSEKADQRRSPLNVVPIATEGSLSNMELLVRGEVDVAVLQSDIAYQSYEGIRQRDRVSDLRLLFVLYEEYVQTVVAKNSEIESLADLAGREIDIGSRGSATYYNALDILGEMGLRAGLGYSRVELPAQEKYTALVDGEVDATFEVAGQLPPAMIGHYSDLRVLPVNEDLANRVIAKNPYFLRAEHRERALGLANPTVAVVALLVARDGYNTELVRQLVVEVEETIGPFLESMGTEQEPVAVTDFPRFAVIPMHDGLKDHLIDLDVLDPDYYPFLAISVAILMFALFLFAEFYTGRHDRLGTVAGVSDSFLFKLLVMTRRIGTFILVTAIFIVTMTLVVQLMKYVETEYARAHNIENAFADMRLEDAVHWIFRFAGTGDDDGMSPESPIGKIIAVVLPFLGVGTVLGLSLVLIERARARRAEKRRGASDIAATGHVLICGWNDRAKGIIYGMTCADAPVRHRIVVVAEIDGDMPLEAHRFNPRYVSYCRGDSANHRVLERANVSRASAAIVLAGQKKRAGRNIRSVLSVLALRQCADSLFVACEMVYAKNERFFDACGADVIVPTETVANLVAANACLTPLIFDYVMDMLTFDGWGELYAVEAEGLVKGLGESGGVAGTGVLEIESLLGVSDGLLRAGVNLLAVRRSGTQPAMLTQNQPDHQYVLPFEDCSLFCNKGDRLVFAADEFGDLRDAWERGASRGERQFGADEHQRHYDVVPKRQNLLLVGDLDRCKDIRDLLADVPCVTCRILADGDRLERRSAEGMTIGNLLDIETWRSSGLATVDVALIVTQSHEQVAAMEGKIDEAELNARSILICKLLRVFENAERSESAHSVRVVVEMYGELSRQLYLDAGADQVVSINLVIERMLTKLVYARSAVTGLITSMLDSADGRYVTSVRISEISDRLVGCSFVELRAFLRPTSLLLAVLPASGRETTYRNKLEDFDCHLEVGTNVDYRADADDEILVLTNAVT